MRPGGLWETAKHLLQGKLDPLTAGGVEGHQYFELQEPKVQLVVSVGEYDAGWWQEHG